MELLLLLLLLAIGMALTDKPGLQQFVWQAGTPVTLDAKNMAPEDQLAIERLLMKTAKGTERKQGNKRLEHEFKYRDLSVLSDIESQDGEVGDFEVWQLGSGSANLTVPDASLNVVREVLPIDPEGEDSGHLILKVYVVY